MSVGDLFIGLCATPLIVFGACLWPPEVVPKEADIGGLARTIGAGTSTLVVVVMVGTTATSVSVPGYIYPFKAEVFNTFIAMEAFKNMIFRT